MGDCLTVIVGEGNDDSRKNIIKAVERKGFQAVSVEVTWPRNSFLRINGTYIRRGPRGLQGNPFGDNGLVLPGDGYALVSDYAFEHEQVKKGFIEWLAGETYQMFPGGALERISKRIVKETVEREGKKQYSNMRVHAVPMGSTYHIDWFSLLIPEKKLLVFDTCFGSIANDNNEFGKVAEKEGLEFVVYDGSQDGVHCPLNSLVLPHRDGLVAFVDIRSRSLHKLLESKGIGVVGVKMPKVNYLTGGVYCQTNAVYSKDVDKIEHLVSTSP
jgi:hypothetical protein